MLILDRHKLDGNKKLERGFPEGKFYSPPHFPLLSFSLFSYFLSSPFFPCVYDTAQKAP